LNLAEREHQRGTKKAVLMHRGQRRKRSLYLSAGEGKEKRKKKDPRACEYDTEKKLEKRGAELVGRKKSKFGTTGPQGGKMGRGVIGKRGDVASFQKRVEKREGTSLSLTWREREVVLFPSSRKKGGVRVGRRKERLLGPSLQ